MTLTLRQPDASELPTASQLCLRSKGYWGYSPEFLAACKEELTLTPSDVQNDRVIIAEDDHGMAGAAHVSMDETGCYLEKLFVNTDRIGQGVGKVLFDWALDVARSLGASEMIVEADPGAVPFYEKMGCTHAGTAPSASIAGRTLPRLVFKL